MATTREPILGGAGPRPPVILLVTKQGTQHPALDDALRAAGMVVVCADPDAAPGFLEASDWPGVRVTMPELILVAGPGMEALLAHLRDRASAITTMVVTVVPTGPALRELVASVLDAVHHGRPRHQPGDKESP